MSESPRVEFPFFVGNDPTLTSWVGFRDLVLHSRPSSAAATGTRTWADASIPSTLASEPAPLARSVALPPDAGVWRLLAANNREIARSARVYSSLAVARAHVLKMREHTDDIVVTQVLGPQRGMRGWFMSLHGQAVMTSSRWYEAASSSADAAADAVEAFRIAVIADTVRSAPHFGHSSGRRDVRLSPVADETSPAVRTSRSTRSSL